MPTYSGIKTAFFIIIIFRKHLWILSVASFNEQGILIQMDTNNRGSHPYATLSEGICVQLVTLTNY